MSSVKMGLKKKVLIVLGGLLVVGAAAASIPATGSGWQERTYYNASGTAIGGTLYDCDGVTRTWGTASGAKSMKITQGPCN